MEFTTSEKIKSIKTKLIEIIIKETILENCFVDGNEAMNKVKDNLTLLLGFKVFYGNRIMSDEQIGSEISFSNINDKETTIIFNIKPRIIK